MKPSNIVETLDKARVFDDKPQSDDVTEGAGALGEVERFESVGKLCGYLFWSNSFESYNVNGKSPDSSIDWDEMTSVFGDDMNKAIEYIKKCFRRRDKPKN